MDLLAYGRDAASEVFTCDPATLRVIDGDTIHCGQKKVRILGYDTPETAKPSRGEPGQEPHATQALQLARGILRSAGAVTVFSRTRDEYGRILGHVVVQHGDSTQLLSVLVLEQRLAYETCSHYGDQGFSFFCDKVKAAARSVARPDFAPPHEYKRALKARR